MYETIRRAVAWLLQTARATLRVLPPVLKWVGAVMVLVSCALLVYLGAILLARMAVWAFFP